jgi:hypothetical protein
MALLPHPASSHRGLGPLREEETYEPEVPEKVPVDIAVVLVWVTGGNVGKGGKI